MRKLRDKNWYKKLNPTPTSGDKVKVVMHRGHLIASRYGIGDQEKKKQTFVYTNAVPQFGFLIQAHGKRVKVTSFGGVKLIV